MGRRPKMEPSWCVRFRFAGMECYTQTFTDQDQALEALAGLEQEGGVRDADIVDL